MTKMVVFKLKKINYLFSLSIIYTVSSQMSHVLDEVDAVPRRVGLYDVKYRYNNEEHVTVLLLKIAEHKKIS